MVGTGRFELPTPRTPGGIAAFTTTSHQVPPLAFIIGLKAVAAPRRERPIPMVYLQFRLGVPTKSPTVGRRLRVTIGLNVRRWRIGPKPSHSASSRRGRTRTIVPTAGLAKLLDHIDE